MAEGKKNEVAVETVRIDDDFSSSEEDRRLLQLGIRRELRKEFSNFSTISFAIGIMGITATIASTLNTPLVLGGRAVAIWSWFLGSFGCVAIAVSVAELASAYPTAGGLYTSTGFVVPPKYRSSVTFVNAWLTLLGQIAGSASVMFALSEMIFAAVTIATDGRFTASVGQILGVYVAVNVVFGILNSLPSRIGHRISYVYGYINVFTTLAITIAIPITGRKSLAPSGIVWNGIVDNSGWNNKGFAFLLGLFCVQYVMTDYDAVAHMSEEVRNAAVATPVAIVVGVVVTAVLGFFLIISACYGIRDISALPGPTGLALAQIILDNVGKDGTLVLWTCVIINIAMVCLCGQLACIRSIYAISRDNVLPDGRIVSKVWSRTKTPIFAAILTVILVSLLGLLALASLIAVNAIFSVCALALDISYVIPIIAKVYISFQKNPEQRFVPGPFYTGRWSVIINLYAIVWTILETGILIMPQVFPVTAATMNYTAPILVAVCGLSWIWYELYWHRHYTGPASDNLLSTTISSVPSALDDVEQEKSSNDKELA
ncbi:TPO5_1 [Sanghuangporus vaninii]